MRSTNEAEEWRRKEREREKVSDQSGPKSCKEKQQATCIEYSKFKPQEGFRELLLDTKSELGAQLPSGQKPPECSPLTLPQGRFLQVSGQLMSCLPGPWYQTPSLPAQLRRTSHYKTVAEHPNLLCGWELNLQN